MTAVMDHRAQAEGTAFIDAVSVAELFVDHSYQRPPDMARARKLAACWDRRLAGVVEVSDRGPGAAVRKGGDDPVVLAIDAAVREFGLQVDPAAKEGNVRCTATLEKLAGLGGVELVSATLSLIHDVWDARVDAYDAPIVHAVGLILHHLHDRIDPERLTDTLLGVLPLSLRTHAAAMGEALTGTAGVRMAITIMVLYNKNRRIPGQRILVCARSFGGGSRNARSLPAHTKSA